VNDLVKHFFDQKNKDFADALDLHRTISVAKDKRDSYSLDAVLLADIDPAAHRRAVQLSAEAVGRGMVSIPEKTLIVSSEHDVKTPHLAELLRQAELRDQHLPKTAPDYKQRLKGKSKYTRKKKRR
jgi:hypothetical protein